MQRPVSAFEFTHAQKENIKQQDHNSSKQTDGLSKRDIKNLIKTKLKKRLKHFDSILGYIE